MSLLQGCDSRGAQPCERSNVLAPSSVAGSNAHGYRVLVEGLGVMVVSHRPVKVALTGLGCSMRWPHEDRELTRALVTYLDATKETHQWKFRTLKTALSTSHRLKKLTTMSR
ncbi:MAG: hypothetical protein ACYDD1_09875 [Caulobacteraceae bacterium]